MWLVESSKKLDILSLKRQNKFYGAQSGEKLMLLVGKTFRSEEPTNQMLQSILQYRWETVKKEEARNT